ncbi:MAG: acyltransferase [Cyclobacteriaceae bacterium]|nr:acyltransferase [Cyclobacteriaceae bacterium]
MIDYLRQLPDRLTRITTSSKLIKEIDGLRFAAILPVVVNHLQQRVMDNAPVPIEENTASIYVGRGGVGVELFFVISGFVLALPFASHYLFGSKKVNLKSYFVRRLTRLEPPYVISMTGFLIVLLVIVNMPFSEIFPHYLASIFYMHNIIYHTWSALNPVAWSLEVEVQFYILAPLLAFVFFSHGNRKHINLLLFISIIAIILIQQYFGLQKPPYFLTILAYFQLFLTGFILVNLYLTSWKKHVVRSYVFDVLGIVAFVGMFMSTGFDLHKRLLLVLFIFLFIYSVFRGKLINSFFTNKWVTSIGGMCYTIYLLHLPLAELYIRLAKPLYIGNTWGINLLIHTLVFLPLVLIISIVFFLLVEKPCMDRDWPKKLIMWFRARFS